MITGCGSQEGTPEMGVKMQELALAEGALPRHLHTSLFTSSSDNRLLTHRSEVKSRPHPLFSKLQYCVCAVFSWFLSGWVLCVLYVCVCVFLCV